MYRLYIRWVDTKEFIEIDGKFKKYKDAVWYAQMEGDHVGDYRVEKV